LPGRPAALASQRGVHEQVLEPAGAAPAHRQFGARDADHMPTRAVAAKFAHLSDCDQVRTVDPDKAVLGPAFLEGGDRDAHQVGAAVGGVQPGIVAVRLHPVYVAAMHKPGHAGELDRERFVLGGCGAAASFGDAPDSLGEPVGI